ncbi:MAG TPA: hypothetical protein VI278_03335 [Nitrososphaeraceae archaeon]
MIFEDLAYLVVGFLIIFLALEAAWHFTGCKFKDETTSSSITAKQLKYLA